MGLTSETLDTQDNIHGHYNEDVVCPANTTFS